ncbi:GNAT family N-acetyltransferase [Novipirellula sp. SH528]|uniref:GNAT family N-acetyltransferase n=1 Tax=Novipirellula sp. SH528 TaxID=3454466 RepID=UPI003FA06FD6
MSKIALRPITDDDQEFLYLLYASTREEELSIAPWDDAQKEEFLRMQFKAQHLHYQKHYSDAKFDVIEVNGEPGGRLYLHRRDDEHRIVDIALLPPFRGKGIGRRIMRQILGEADKLHLPVRIHVEHNNPAKHLYDRLGFKKIDDTGVYFLMEHLPSAKVCLFEDANSSGSEIDPSITSDCHKAMEGKGIRSQ